MENTQLDLTRKPAGNRTAALGITLALAIALAVYLAETPYAAAGYTLVLLALAMVAGAATLTPWRRLPVSKQDQAGALAELDSEHVRKCEALHKALRCSRAIWGVVSLVPTLLLALTPVGPALIRSLGDSRTTQLVLGILVVTAVSVAVGLPLAVAKHRLLVRFGVSEQKWPDWIRTTAKATLLGLIIFGLFLACLYTGIAVAPGWWWLWALAGMVGVSTAVSLVFPRWLLPLLSKAKPLDDGALRSRLLRLAEQNGVNVSEVYVTDTSRKTKGLGAAVAGYGPARRILVADNLLNKAPAAEAAPAASDAAAEAKLADTTVRGATDDQIAVVVAHELAHAKYQDPISGQLVGLVKLGMVLCSIYLLSGWGWLLGLPGVESVTDPEALGLLLLMVSLGTQWLSPVTAWMSRRKEAYADWYALTVTGDPVSLEQFWQKVVQTNLVDPSPRRSELLLASHPPVVDRIALTKAYGRNRNGAGEVAGALAPASRVTGQVAA